MEIKFCKTCDGKGTIRGDVVIHNSERHTCSPCNGTGRVKTGSFSYIVPYDMDSTEIYKVENEIINLIRKLESIKIICNTKD